MRAITGRLLAKGLQLLEEQWRSLWYRWVRFAWIRFGRGVTFSGPLHSLGLSGTITVGDMVFFGPWVSLSVAGGADIAIGSNVSVNKGCVIGALARIEIGDGCRIGENVSIRDNDHRINGREPILASGFKSAPVTIGRDVWIGRNVTVMPGVTIGEGAVIGANTLVNRDVPAFAVVVGAPCREIRQR